LGRLLAISENYPDLKANETMQQLMEELASTENRVGFARQAFNDAVMEYNIAREKFPNFFVAGAFGFPQATTGDLQCRKRASLFASASDRTSESSWISLNIKPTPGVRPGVCWPIS
jgi:hypothetical protein